VYAGATPETLFRQNPAPLRSRRYVDDVGCRAIATIAAWNRTGADVPESGAANPAERITMANVGTIATSTVFDFLVTPAGLSENLAAVTELCGHHAASDPARSRFLRRTWRSCWWSGARVKYPTHAALLRKISNELREKFRTFSGKARLALEVRGVAGSTFGAGKAARDLCGHVTRFSTRTRGDWGNGMFYTGGYEAVFGEMKHGGRNFIQTAKITFEVAVSID